MKKSLQMKKLTFARWGSFLLVLVFCVSIQAQAQDIAITGKIADDTGEPLPGASILVRGTNQGTVSDFDGNYSLTAPADATLVISFIGYKEQEQLVNSRSIINIIMEIDISSLEEIVVIGYGEVRKSDLTGAVSSIRAQEIQNSNSNDVVSALQGRVTGVQITQASGAPGAGVNIQVRGVNSINAGASPLYVIDGIQVGGSDDRSVNPLLDLDPADIESMEILKDASALAIYGARGSNGVVLITTKKGVAGTSKINLSVEHGVTTLANELELMNNTEYAIAQSMFANQRALRNDPAAAFRNNIYDDILANGLENHPDFRPWTEKLIENGSNTEVNLSASGGNEKGSYRVSVGLNDITGIVENSGLERLNARITLDQNINDRIKVGFNVSGARVNIEGFDQTGVNNGIMSRLMFANPFIPLLNNPSAYLSEGSGSFDINNLGIEDSVTRVRNSPDNFFATEQASETNQTYRGRLSLDYKIIPGLTFRIAGNFNTNIRSRQNSASPQSRNAFDTNGEVRLRENKSTTWIAETSLSYNKTVAQNHTLSTIVVGEIQETTSESTDVTNIGFGDFVSGVNNFGSGTTFLSAPFRSSSSSLASVLGRVNYNYDDRYLLTLSGRLDASSRFPEGNKSAFFRAVAVGWNIHNEDFMEPVGVITNLKLRSSFGETGNQSIPVGASQTTFSRDLIVLGDGNTNDRPTTVWVPDNAGNPNLVWEKHQTIDVGLEIGLLGGRINVESGYFNKEVTDVLFNRPLPSHLGFTEAFDNIGTISSRGWEHSVSAIVLDKSDFQITLNANISFIKSLTTQLTDENDFLVGERAEGWQYQFAKDDPIGNWKGFILDGTYNTTEELSNAPPGTQRTEWGTWRFTDVNMDGIVDDNDIAVLGNSLPFATGGFGASIAWKGFDLYTFFQFSQGGDIVNSNISGAFSGRSDNTLASIRESLYRADNPFGEFSNHFGTNGVNANRNIENGDFIRWANLSLGYNIPGKYLESFKLSSARVSVQANNLHVFTRYSWLDPEVNSLAGNARGGFLPGFDDSVYPRNRLWQFAIHLGL